MAYDWRVIPFDWYQRIRMAVFDPQYLVANTEINDSDLTRLIDAIVSLQNLRAKLAETERERDARYAQASASFEEFWKELITIDGKLDEQKVRYELLDYYTFMEEAAKVYEHVTNGRISKINTLSREIIPIHDDFVTETCDEAIAEATEELRAELAAAKDLATSLAAGLLCDVCCGQPLASGKPCICGGTNNKLTAFDNLRVEFGHVEQQVAAAKERERAAVEMIRELLASAFPNAKEHPTMFAAWTKARAAFPEVAK